MPSMVTWSGLSRSSRRHGIKSAWSTRVARHGGGAGGRADDAESVRRRVVAGPHHVLVRAHQHQLRLVRLAFALVAVADHLQRHAYGARRILERLHRAVSG